MMENEFKYHGAENNAQPEVKAAVERFRNLPDAERKKMPLLYWMIGSGTPPYKVSKGDSDYTDLAITPKNCANCEYMYKKTGTGEYICSQISGNIQPEGWCDRWEKIQPRKTAESRVPGIGDKIPGGFSGDRNPSDFNQSDLKKGIKIELEHTSDEGIAQEIARDHLMEDPKYYNKLEKMEKEATPNDVYAPWGPVDNVNQVRNPKNKGKKKMKKNHWEYEEGSIMDQIEMLRERGASLITNLEQENPAYKKYQNALTYLDRIADGIKDSDVQEKKVIDKSVDGTFQADLDKMNDSDVKKWDLNEYNNTYIAKELLNIAKTLM